MNKHLRRGLAVISGCLLWMTICLPRVSVYAQFENPIQNDELPMGGNVGDSSDLFLSLLKVIFFLIVIIGLIYVIVKFLAKKNQSWFGKRSVRVLSGVQLAPNKTLQIVEIGSTVYILGVGEDVRLIDKIADPQLAAMIIDQFEVQESNSLTPAISQWLKKWRGGKDQHDLSDQSTSFQDIFQDRMSRVTEQNRKIEDMLSSYEQDEKERSKQ